MAGSPIKRERNRLVREAILREAEGKDPVEVMIPYVEKLLTMAREGDIASQTTLGALREIFDRVDGKVVDNSDNGPVGVTVQILNLLSAPQTLEALPEPKLVEGVREEPQA